MTNPSSTSIEKRQNKWSLIRALVTLAATATIILMIWVLGASQADPYVKATLRLNGASDKGEQLFRMNCAGCHGISAQGLVGPTLHKVSSHRNDVAIINQIVQGSTPPMPSFEMEPQAMADLLAHLHKLS